jgi:Domain of unknown function (DUF4175)
MRDRRPDGVDEAAAMRRWGRFGLLLPLAASPAWAQGPDPAHAPPAGPPTAAQVQRQGDTRMQAALRRVLGVLMQQHGDLTGKVPEPLNDADIAMREAIRALQAGDDAAASTAIQKAIEALQKGGRSMSQQLAQQFGRQGQPGEDGDQGEEGEDGEGQMAGDQDGNQPGDQDGQGPGHQRGHWNSDGRRDGRRQADRGGEDRRDPLGRKLREDGHGATADESGVQVPDEMEQARAHAIQEELRRRGGEKTRPQPELDYIDRLLRQF